MGNFNMGNFLENKREKIVAIAIALLLAVFVNRSLWLIVESFTDNWGIHISLVFGGILGAMLAFFGFTMPVKSISHGFIGAGAILLLFGLATLILPKYPEFKTVLVGMTLALFLWIGLKHSQTGGRLKNAEQ